MIQTQLLTCDKPYQIISAAGMVGIQVATLIVTEDKVDKDGNYLIDTHSHPVVNYASKEGLTEQLNYYDGNPDNEYKYIRRLKPEGAVWNKVEVRDVRVLGLVGAKNIPIDLETFVNLVPSADGDHTEHLWNRETANAIYSIHFDLERLGMTYSLSNAGIYSDEYFNKEIHLAIEKDLNLNPVVMVKLREGNFYGAYPIGSLFFKYSPSTDVKKTIEDISFLLNTLRNIFKLNKDIKFVYEDSESGMSDEWENHVIQLTKELNELQEKRLKGII